MLCYLSRRIILLDAATGGIAGDWPCRHSKAVHGLALPKPSQHVSLSASAYQLFSSVAADGIVTVWDLRVPQPVFSYSNHRNRCEAVQIAFSPCMQTLAVGSEDGAARLVDLRTCRELCKLPTHRDVCGAVAYNPMQPQLACASYDGDLRFYSDS